MATKKAKTTMKKEVKKEVKKVVTQEIPLSSYKEPKRVSIQKARNGYVVSCYGDRGEVVEVAKSMVEASRISKKMLKG